MSYDKPKPTYYPGEHWVLGEDELAPMFSGEELPEEVKAALAERGEVKYDGGITKLYPLLGDDLEELNEDEEYFELAQCSCGCLLCFQCGSCPAAGECECD